MSLPTWPFETSPFHRGERALQRRIGVEEQYEALGRRMMRTELIEQHRLFFQELRTLFIGHVDAHGRPWASIVVGEPGFLSTPDVTTLSVRAAALHGDLLAEHLTMGQPLGVVGVQLATRRRNRMNGTVSASGPEGFSIAVDQSFGNCPQYIHKRVVTETVDIDVASLPPVEVLAGLDDEARRHIRSAETFFVSSIAPKTEGLAGGADMSHRGGNPGFIGIEDGHTLVIPDFSGNKIFNTLGNFLLNPVAGLLFVDFDTGDVLQLTGRVELIWDGPEVEAYRGAERIWRVVVTETRRLRGRCPLRWSRQETSPVTQLTGTWDEYRATRGTQNWRAYVVVDVVDESPSIRSWWMKPTTGQAVPPFIPGQHVALRAPLPSGETVQRTYTVSSAPHDTRLRISVRRQAGGQMSTWLHDHLSTGDTVELRGPAGGFRLQQTRGRRSVLLSAGVGITPMVSMLRHIVNGQGPRQPVLFLHGSRDGTAFRTEVKALIQAVDAEAHWFISNGTAHANAHSGRIGVEVLAAHLNPQFDDIYLCGPGSFMQEIYRGVRDLGVPDEHIFTEAFGPSHLKRSTTDAAPTVSPARVVFADGSAATWTGSGTLLELAERSGQFPPSGCRGGACGTCLVRLVAGTVTHSPRPSALHNANEALLCCARPTSAEVRLDV